MIHEFRYTLQNMLQCCLLLLLRWWWLWCCQSIKWFKGVMMLSGDYFWLPLFMVQMALCTHMRFSLYMQQHSNKPFFVYKWQNILWFCIYWFWLFAILLYVYHKCLIDRAYLQNWEVMKYFLLCLNFAVSFPNLYR